MRSCNTFIVVFITLPLPLPRKYVLENYLDLDKDLDFHQVWFFLFDCKANKNSQLGETDHSKCLMTAKQWNYFSEGEKRRPEMRLLFAGYSVIGGITYNQRCKHHRDGRSKHFYVLLSAISVGFILVICTAVLCVIKNRCTLLGTSYR